MYCDCFRFRIKLKNFIKTIFTQENPTSHWEMFERFLAKNTGGTLHYVSVNIEETSFKSPCTTFCLQKVSSLLVSKMEDFRMNNMLLSTLLVDLLSLFLSYDCVRNKLDWLWDFENRSFSSDRETHRVICGIIWNKDFMKLLLNFGYFSSLAGDSPRLKEVLNEELCNFM